MSSVRRSEKVEVKAVLQCSEFSCKLFLEFKIEDEFQECRRIINEIFEDYILSYDVASGSEITPCNKIDKPLVVYRFTGNVMTSITTLRT